MLWNVTKPRDTGGFEGDGGIEAAGDGAVDDGLLLLVEQRDHLPFRPDRPVQPPVRPVQKSHYRRLFGGRGDRKRFTLQELHRNPHPVRENPVANADEAQLKRLRGEDGRQVSRIVRVEPPSKDVVDRTKAADISGAANRTDDDIHAIHDDVI